MSLVFDSLFYHIPRHNHFPSSLLRTNLDDNRTDVQSRTNRRQGAHTQIIVKRIRIRRPYHIVISLLIVSLLSNIHFFLYISFQCRLVFTLHWGEKGQGKVTFGFEKNPRRSASRGGWRVGEGLPLCD